MTTITRVSGLSTPYVPADELNSAQTVACVVLVASDERARFIFYPPASRLGSHARRVPLTRRPH